MKPVFIEVETRKGESIVVNANAILYYHFIGLGPGLGLRLYFSENFFIEITTAHTELNNMIEQVLKDQKKKGF